jgi:signal transduction histidine kinase
MKKIKTTKLKYKTLFYLILFSAFILLLLWESQLLLSKLLYERYQISDINKVVKSIEKTDSIRLDVYLKEVVYNNAVCIEYVNTNSGTTKLYNDAQPGCLLGRGDSLDSYKEELLNSNKNVEGIKISSKDYNANGLLYRIYVDNGYVYVFTMLKNVNKNYSIVKNQLIYIAIVVLVLAIIISLYLSRLITDPIVEITDKSKELANGNYNVKFEKNGIKEIDELADTLNYLESEVTKTDEYRRDLMANVSHDLKTPLTMIKAYAEMVRDITYKDKKKREENLNVIIDETDRLNALVGDILTLSKVQANSDTLEIETFDLHDEINELLKRYDYLKEDGYEVVAEMPDSIKVRADKNKLNQVIYNLVNNAINYTGKDKKVTIRVTANKKDYLVEVIDTGKGIEKDKIEHIWDRYYKNEKNHKRNVVGTGLGLSIVKSILEEHDIPYGVNSVLGKGTTFYFKIKKLNVKR